MLDGNRSSSRSVDNSQKKPIFIFVSDFNGLGDLIYGMRLFQLMKSKYPNEDIKLVFDKPESIEKLKSVLPELQRLIDDKQVMTNHALLYEQNEYNEQGMISPKLLIEGPVFRQLTNFEKYFDQDTHVLLTTEYNDLSFRINACFGQIIPKNCHYIPTGINPGSPTGLYIDEDLHQFTQRDGSLEKKRFDELTSFREQHQQNGNPSQIRTVTSHLLSVTDTKSYLEKTEVSFAYHPKLQPHYAASMIAVAGFASQPSSMKDNVDYFIGGDIGSIKAELLSGQTVRDEFKDALFSLGYSRIELVGMQDEPIIIQNEKNGDGKTFRVFYQNRFSHDEMKMLFKLSNFAGVTGDQSLSEALSSGVVPVYSVMPHKRNLNANLAETYNTINPRAELGKYYAELASNSDSRSSDLNSYYKKVANIGKIFANDNLIDAFRNANSYIATTHNLQNVIAKKVDQVFDKIAIDQAFREQIKAAIDINEIVNEGKTLLQLAIEKNDLKSVELILSRPDLDILKKSSATDDEPERTALHFAIINENIQVIKLLLQHKNSNDLISTPDSKGFTPLHYICDMENLNAAELILAKKPAVTKAKIADENGNVIDKLPSEMINQEEKPELFQALSKYEAEYESQLKRTFSMIETPDTTSNVLKKLFNGNLSEVIHPTTTAKCTPSDDLQHEASSSMQSEIAQTSIGSVKDQVRKLNQQIAEDQVSLPRGPARK